MSKGSKEALIVLLITFLIFNQFSIQKKVLESWDLDLSNHTIQCYVCWRGQKLFWLSTLSTSFKTQSIGWYGWNGLSFSFSKKIFRIENQLNIKKVMSKNVMSSYSIFLSGQRPLYTEYTFYPLTWVRWVTLICIQCCAKATNTTFDPFDMSNMSNN